MSDKAVIVFPDLLEFPKMDVIELVQWKLKLEYMEDIIKRLIREKIQR